MADIQATTVIDYCLDKNNQTIAAKLEFMQFFKTYRAKYDDLVQDRHLKVYFNISPHVYYFYIFTYLVYSLLMCQWISHELEMMRNTNEMLFLHLLGPHTMQFLTQLWVLILFSQNILCICFVI